MKRVFVLAGVALAALAGAASDADIAADVAADTVRPVRQGGVDGQAYWNGKSVLFLYPPAFDFKPVDGAVKYRYVLEDDARNVVRFEAATPNEALTPVWGRLSTGMYRLEVLGINARGRVAGLAGYRRFWKSAAFCPADCPKGVCGYAEASTKYFDWLFRTSYAQSYLKNGVPDEDYNYNAYPSKMDSALVEAFVSYAELRPEHRKESLTIARRAADHLLALMNPAGSPLEHFPHTYRVLKPSKPFAPVDAHANEVAAKYSGQVMVVYPAIVGNAFLTLHGAIRERKYLDAAIRIAETYAKLQGEDGTWYLKLWEKDGTPVAPNRLFPLAVCNFLERVYAATGTAKYRTMSDRAFAYVEKGPLADWNWEAQFEDVEPPKPYRNLTVHTPVATALHLLKRYPDDPARRAQARECLRFAEDQFVLWKMPFRKDGTGPISYDTPMNTGSCYEEWFDVPGAYEQYNWYLPIDSSAAKMIRGYLAFYKAEGREADLAKARALGDAITIMQAKHGKDGAIPTHWVKWEVGQPTHPWINCGIGTANTLKALSEAGRALCGKGEAADRVESSGETKRTGGVGCAGFDNGRRPVVAIPDYLATNGVVSADRSMTEALRDAGFVPVVLPEMDRTSVREILLHCDAVMIGGGAKEQDYVRRCAFEDMVISLAAERNLPIVGVCHGAQVINRHFGGTLETVPAEGGVVHMDAERFKRTRELAEHDAIVLPGDSLMARVFNTGTVRINSSHKKRCLKLADGFKVTARTADGVIEAYEHVSRPIFGFQFHPEYHWQRDRRCLELLRHALTP